MTTRRFFLSTAEHDLWIETDATDEQMEGTFKAWCLDEHEWFNVNGWMIEDMTLDTGRTLSDAEERRAEV